MLRTILVPLDGSTFAEHALSIARGIAVRSGATIIPTHVHVPVFDRVADPWLLGGVPTLDDSVDAEQHARAMDYLTARSTELAAGDIRVSCNLLGGPVVPTLVEHAETIAADLVVMTTHGHGAFSRMWLGSVADAFVRHSPVPTLLVRPQHDEQAAHLNAEQSFTMRRVLIPLDGSPLAEQILQPATALAQTMGAEVVLLRLVEPLRIVGYTSAEIATRDDECMRPLLDDAQAFLRGVAAHLREQGHAVRTNVAVAKAPAWSILHVAGEEACDVIALATHGCGGLRRLLIGSVADKIVRGAHVPVLLLRPQRQDSATPTAS